MTVEPQAQAYIDAIDPQFRPLFDRLQGLILGAFPEAEVKYSYGIPTYVVGKRRIHLGVWQHGASIYGWNHDAAGDLFDKHPGLRTGKGTMKLTLATADEITDDELLGLIRATLTAEER